MKLPNTHHYEDCLEPTFMKSPNTYYVEDCCVVNTDYETIAIFTGFVHVFLNNSCFFRGIFKSCNGFSIPDPFSSRLVGVPPLADDCPPLYFLFLN